MVFILFRLYGFNLLCILLLGAYGLLYVCTLSFKILGILVLRHVMNNTIIPKGKKKHWFVEAQ